MPTRRAVPSRSGYFVGVLDWITDTWLWLWESHTYGGMAAAVVLALLALCVVLAVLLGVLKFIAHLGRSFAEGWRQGGNSKPPAP